MWKKYNIAVRVMLVSDFIECVICAFVGPIVQKGVYANQAVTSRMIAIAGVAGCLATIIWNKIFSEERRYKLFKKTYVLGLISYAAGMSASAVIASMSKSVLFYWWLEFGVGLTFGHIWSQGNQEFYGNLFSTEDRKSFDRLHSTLVSAACLIGGSLAIIPASFSLWLALLIWCFSFFMDAGSMSFAFVWLNKRGLLEPRKEN